MGKKYDFKKIRKRIFINKTKYEIGGMIKMCTSLKYKTCMGRNYDYEQSFDEEVRIIDEGEFDNKYKIIGVATGFIKDFPLLYDGMNQHGLCISGLAFEGNAKYFTETNDKNNIASFRLPLEILGRFKNVDEAQRYLNSANITDEAYSPQFPPSDMHWMVCDRDKAIIVESTSDGLNIYDAETGVMTNNPPYPNQLEMAKESMSQIGVKDDHIEYDSRGKETYGLLGDYTSFTRFAKLSYLKGQLENSKNSFDDVNQTFHLLSSVEQIYGLTHVEDRFEYTIYSIVYDMENLKVYYKVYDDFNVSEYGF